MIVISSSLKMFTSYILLKYFQLRTEETQSLCSTAAKFSSDSALVELSTVFRDLYGPQVKVLNIELESNSDLWITSVDTPESIVVEDTKSAEPKPSTSPYFDFSVIRKYWLKGKLDDLDDSYPDVRNNVNYYKQRLILWFFWDLLNFLKSSHLGGVLLNS